MTVAGDDKPKLYYFDTKGRAYPCKVIFNVGNVAFEDFKFDMNEWAKHKKDMPMGQVPVLEYKKQKMCQSQAVAQFAAELAGFCPKDAWEKSKVMEFMGCCEDVYNKIYSGFAEKDATKKKEMRAKLCKETFPEFFASMDKMVAANNHPGFCVGDKFTAADAYVFCMVDQIKCEQFEYVPSNFADQYHNMTKVYETVMKNPKVKECKSSEDKCKSPMKF